MNQKKKRRQGKKSKSAKASSALPSPPTIVAEKPIPDFLRRRGITRVINNIPEGKEIRLPPRTLMILFGKEILQALNTRQEKCESNNKKVKKKSKSGGRAKRSKKRRGSGD